MVSTNSSFSKILAKFDPEITLKNHIGDCLEVFKKIVKTKEITIERLCEKASIDKEMLLINTSLIIMLHDIGKCTLDFQNKKGGRGAYPHALMSLILSRRVFEGSTILKINGQDIQLELAAIESHHSRLIHHKYADYDSLIPPSVDPNCLREAEHFIEELYKELWHQKRSIKLSSEENPITCVSDVEQSWAIIRRSGAADRARDTFCLLKGILNYCDWSASAKKSLAGSISNIHDTLIQNLRRRSSFKTLCDFQQRALVTKGDVLLRAPTGKGKTEAALLWAHGNNIGRVIYLLPTMVTSNSMYQRMQTLWGQELTGLCHSTAPFVLRTEAEESDIEDDADFAYNYLLDKTFMKPFVIATLDQLLYSLLNNGRWEVSWFNSCASGIVIDEVHAYQPFTVGLAVECLSQLKESGSKAILMSATLPSGLKNFLAQTLNISSQAIIEDSEFSALRRHRINLHRCPIDEAAKDILKEFRKGQRVLVICNTIRRAIEIFEILSSHCDGNSRFKEESLRILHSQYILRDRQKKEQELIEEEKKSREDRRPIILVATQVIEVSLDIDFDVLFTEVAPIDALIQRMGRVNRRSEGNIRDIHIYEPSGDSFYIYKKGLIEATLDSLSRMNKTPTTCELGKVADTVYPKNVIFDEMEKGREEAKITLSDIRLRLLGILSLSPKDEAESLTRPTDYPTMVVIPEKFRDEAMRLKPWQRLGLTVKAPIAICKERLLMDDDTGIPFVKLDYDPIKGLHHPKNSRNGIFI